MAELRFRPRARADILDIWLHIGAENPTAADKVTDAIERRLQQLVGHPYSGLLREDIGQSIRHLVAGQYLAFYRVMPEFIDVLRVLHGKRRIEPDDMNAGE